MTKAKLPLDVLNNPDLIHTRDNIYLAQKQARHSRFSILKHCHDSSLWTIKAIPGEPKVSLPR